MRLITVRHNFETAHRLPFLGGKCENLHGHSWWVEFKWAFDLNDEGISSRRSFPVDYGALKKDVRSWIDEHLDHGTMLGVNDPLVQEGHIDLLGKVFYFGTETSDGWGFPDKPWPTVEAVAELLSFVAPHSQHLVEVEVQETYTNKAIWRK
jgi:6-pyruvoyltetrahydropterin/6-carboxytetrahydropterin synthase